MKRNLGRAFLTTAALLTVVLLGAGKTWAADENEATKTCITVISQKPGLASFQFNEIKAESNFGGWRITGKISNGADKRKFICKVDDRGRVGSAVVASDSPELGAQ